MSTQLTGSCLCGGFKYMVKNPLNILMNCHCGMCRKAIGAAFFSAFMLPKDDFVLLEASTVASYRSSEHVLRYFCQRCGCSTHGEDPNYPNVYCLIPGTLDGDPAIKVSGECFTKYKAPWQKLCEGVPHSEEEEVFYELIKTF